jgi:hypothetical protein
VLKGGRTRSGWGQLAAKYLYEASNHHRGWSEFNTPIVKFNWLVENYQSPLPSNIDSVHVRCGHPVSFHGVWISPDLAPSRTSFCVSDFHRQMSTLLSPFRSPVNLVKDIVVGRSLVSRIHWILLLAPRSIDNSMVKGLPINVAGWTSVIE